MGDSEDLPTITVIGCKRFPELSLVSKRVLTVLLIELDRFAEI